MGSYNIAIFAKDEKGSLSMPQQTRVTRGSDCLPVGRDFSIVVPCAEYHACKYRFSLDFYHNPDDLGGFYWKLILSTLTTGEGAFCIPIGSDLSMPMDCVSYNGTQYGFTLRAYANPYDSGGLYWKLDGSTLEVK